MTLIKLSSNGHTNSHDFTTFFSDFRLDPTKEYEIALINASLWYSWYNISDSLYDNARFNYYNGSITRINQKIPDGLYELSSLSTAIQRVIEGNSDDMENIALSGDYTTGRVQIVLKNNYQIDLQLGNLHTVLGFGAVNVSGNSTHTGSTNADISNSIDNILIRTNLISGAYLDGTASDILWSFTPNRSPYELLEVDPKERVYQRLDKQGGSGISRLRLYLTDQNNRAIDLNGETFSALLHIRPVKDEL